MTISPTPAGPDAGIDDVPLVDRLLAPFRLFASIASAGGLVLAGMRNPSGSRTF